MQITYKPIIVNTIDISEPVSSLTRQLNYINKNAVRSEIRQQIYYEENAVRPEIRQQGYYEENAVRPETWQQIYYEKENAVSPERRPQNYVPVSRKELNPPPGFSMIEKENNMDRNICPNIKQRRLKTKRSLGIHSLRLEKVTSPDPQEEGRLSKS